MTFAKFTLFALPVLLIGGCCTRTSIPLTGTSGMEKPVAALGPERFYPYSKVIKPYGKRWLLRNPDREKFFTTGFRDIQLDPSKIYELRMSFTGWEKGTFYLRGNEYNGDKLLKSQMLAQSTTFLNVNGLTNYIKEFTVSPETTRLEPVLIFANPGKKGQVNQLMIDKLEIVETGTMKKASATISAMNLAEKYDFSKYPDGDFKYIFKGRGANAKEWSDISAKVVRINGEAMLHIIRKPANYIYPWMDLQDFPIDPQYHFVKLSFKVKGSGAIRPGLWWKRRTMGCDYYHGPTVNLSDKWQTVSLIHPCMTPDVKRATMSFSSKGDGEFFIKDIRVNML